MCVTMETSGAITGVAYWFELALGDNQTISTGPSAYEGVCPYLLFIVLMCSVRVILSRIPYTYVQVCHYSTIFVTHTCKFVTTVPYSLHIRASLSLQYHIRYTYVQVCHYSTVFVTHMC